MAVCLVCASLSAHRRDELLQAARLDVGPARLALELDLTPGIALADAVIAEVDVDGDGVLTAAEGQPYARRVASALELSLDGRALQLDAVAASFPDLGALRRGEGTIELRAAIDLPPAPPERHQLSFRNTYRADVGVYLANALVPESDRVVVTAQRRDPEQRSLTIDYRVGVNPATMPLWPLGAIGIATLCVASAFRRTTRSGSSRPSTLLRAVLSLSKDRTPRTSSAFDVGVPAARFVRGGALALASKFIPSGHRFVRQ